MRDRYMAQCEPCIQIKKKKDKKKKESQKENKGGDGQGVSVKEEKREREKGEKGFFTYLRSTEIEPLVFVGTRRKVDPRIASYVWVPKSWSFIKLHEVGNFPTWNIFSLKVI